MPNYFYVAKSFDGQTQTGTMEAADERTLAQTLKNQNMLLVSAVPEGSKKKSLMNMEVPFLGVSAGEKIMITRNLGVMVSTGLSLVKSFEILAGQTKNKTLYYLQWLNMRARACYFLLIYRIIKAQVKIVFYVCGNLCWRIPKSNFQSSRVSQNVRRSGEICRCWFKGKVHHVFA